MSFSTARSYASNAESTAGRARRESNDPGVARLSRAVEELARAVQEVARAGNQMESDVARLKR